MAVDPPTWFKQRQCKAEPHEGDALLKLTGPNLGEAYLRVVQGENALWQASLRRTPDGEDIAATNPEYTSAIEAWSVAFELYRTHVIA